MDLINCKKCGRTYGNDGIDLCPKCRHEDLENEFKLVKDYLYDNPGAEIKEVSEETGVSTQKILKFLREGRIEISEGSHNALLECEHCGKAIRSGRFCEKCVEKLKKEFKNMADTMEKKAAPEKPKPAGDKLFVASRYGR